MPRMNHVYLILFYDACQDSVSNTRHAPEQPEHKMEIQKLSEGLQSQVFSSLKNRRFMASGSGMLREIQYW
jgi:hypothetical protein